MSITYWLLTFTAAFLFLHSVLITFGYLTRDEAEESEEQEESVEIAREYKPIEGVRYLPHWYLKEPLQRNVVEKPQGCPKCGMECECPSDETGSGEMLLPTPGIVPPSMTKLNGVSNDLRLTGEQVSYCNGRAVVKKFYEQEFFSSF